MSTDAIKKEKSLKLVFDQIRSLAIVTCNGTKEIVWKIITFMRKMNHSTSLQEHVTVLPLKEAWAPQTCTCKLKQDIFSHLLPEI